MSIELVFTLIISIIAASGWASKIAYDLGVIRSSLSGKLEHTELRTSRLEKIADSHETRLLELETDQ